MVINKYYNYSYNLLVIIYLSKKYIGFELDIRETLDKKIVISHDPFIDGLLISKTKYSALKKYNVILLEEVLKLKTSKIILIEIKDFNMNLDNLVNILNKYSSRNIYVMSFSKKVIHKLTNNNFKVGVLNYVLNSESDYKDYDFICLLEFSVTNNLIEYFKSHKIEIFVYGILGKLKNYQKDIYYIIDNH